MNNFEDDSEEDEESETETVTNECGYDVSWLVLCF